MRRDMGETHDTAPLRMYWWKAKPNFGDALNPILLSLLSGVPVEWSDSADQPVLTCVGSVIDHAKPGWAVWGSGLVADDVTAPPDLRILALRGPKTRERLVSLKHDPPAIFGDPCLLMPVVWPLPHARVKYEWGFIPHYVDLSRSAMRHHRSLWMVRKLREVLRREHSIVIDPRLPIEEYVRRFARCRAIVSSSLHGVVMAEAYGKPCVWIRFADSRDIIGGEFKFRDFFEGVGKQSVEPMVVGDRFNYECLKNAVQVWQPIRWDPVPLMRAFPYQTDKWKVCMETAAKYFGALGEYR